VSKRLPSGKVVAAEGETARKFVALHPNLVLAGSSTISGAFDRIVFERMQKFVELLPAASFENVVAELRQRGCSASSFATCSRRTKVSLVIPTTLNTSATVDCFSQS
jgi:hypothetical protein